MIERFILTSKAGMFLKFYNPSVEKSRNRSSWTTRRSNALIFTCREVAENSAKELKLIDGWSVVEYDEAPIVARPERAYRPSLTTKEILRELKAALEFYADDATYDGNAVYPEGDEPALEDGGKRARKALEFLKRHIDL